MPCSLRWSRPGDRVLSLDLAAGGHLSHGLRSNLSGRWFEAHHYGVSRETGMIDYDDVEAKALEVQPRILIAGGSSYPRTLDFERLARTANKVGARFVVDMAHFAGLVAGGAHPSPIPHADIVTTTTTKTLRGPRGGMILARDESWKRKLQTAVFPGHLILFDRAPDRPWAEKIFRRPPSGDGAPVTIWGM